MVSYFGDDVQELGEISPSFGACKDLQRTARRRIFSKSTSFSILENSIRTLLFINHSGFHV